MPDWGRAQRLLARNKVGNVTAVVADDHHGYPAAATFDRLVHN